MQIEHSEFQEQLVCGLSHRMNNILTLFHGYIGLLLSDKQLDEGTLAGLAKIKEGATAASELIDRTHALARPSSGAWRQINLRDFISVLRPSFVAYAGPRTELALDLGEGLPLVWGDAMRVKTAIVELVRNALDATSGGGRVELSLRVVEHPGAGASESARNCVCVSVCDDGPGIPGEVGDRIYLPFFTTRRRKNNTGLGLTMARSYAQQMGGTIRFTSEAGRTEFQLLLPVHAPEEVGRDGAPPARIGAVGIDGGARRSGV